MSENEKTLTGPELLRHFEDNWETEMGAWFPGERVVLRGKNIFSAFDASSWMEYLIYGITGEEKKEYSKFLEGIWRLTTSYPDPRLWNNRIAALAGTARSTGALGTAAAIAASEATIYGLRPIKGALDFLYRVDKQLAEGGMLADIIWAELKKHRSVYGYGRPMINEDERIQPFMKFAQSLGFRRGKYLKLAFEIEEYLKSSRLRYQINAAGMVAGFVADNDISPDTHYHMGILCFVAGIIPCYIDTLDHKEGTFFPLATYRINYTGLTANRKWDQEI